MTDHKGERIFVGLTAIGVIISVSAAALAWELGRSSGVDDTQREAISKGVAVRLVVDQATGETAINYLYCECQTCEQARAATRPPLALVDAYREED